MQFFVSAAIIIAIAVTNPILLAWMVGVAIILAIVVAVIALVLYVAFILFNNPIFWIAVFGFIAWVLFS